MKNVNEVVAFEALPGVHIEAAAKEALEAIQALKPQRAFLIFNGFALRLDPADRPTKIANDYAIKLNQRPQERS